MLCVAICEYNFDYWIESIWSHDILLVNYFTQPNAALLRILDISRWSSENTCFWHKTKTCISGNECACPYEKEELDVVSLPLSTFSFLIPTNFIAIIFTFDCSSTLMCQHCYATWFIPTGPWCKFFFFLPLTINCLVIFALPWMILSYMLRW